MYRAHTGHTFVDLAHLMENRRLKPHPHGQGVDGPTPSVLGDPNLHASLLLEIESWNNDFYRVYCEYLINM